MMNKIEKIYNKSDSASQYAENYIQYIGEVFSKISTAEIELFAKTLLNARDRASSIYFIGNGGSATTASHFANDIGIGTKSSDKPFRVISLCDNNSVITAIANDYGYEDIFLRQLEILLNEQDVVVAISASGNSENLLRAINFAKNKGAITVGLTSFSGGKLKKEVDILVHIPAQEGEYGPAEDGHMMLDHLISSYLYHYLKK
ncbi:D-sedoheptulose-7-phosphate isomerase [Candidatus Thioglobus autotrophicus]|uniref:D-sedoheptulose-7-phosphate isomerase n=1 Tax=Candidatus Thioglobus autotrophicus TaxID=1705394 RepID=UPI00299DE2FA|nr:SIS domain-containing protein [Candidatus Thioglobus autotrophicus]WPE17773.1 SIS domain-containing protein [Candidatus Thioglobus autotrophicus]